MADKLDTLGTRMSLVVTAPFTLLTARLAKTLSEFEQLDVAFQTIIGDTDKANALLNTLLKTAAQTPFGISEITQNAKQLLAVGVAYEDINDTIIDLGNVAAGLSVPLERLILNF